MNRKEIEDELINGISAIAAEEGGNLTAETPLSERGIDSLMLVEIFVFIEKKFNLQLLESDIKKEDLESIRSLASYISSKV